MSRWGPSLHRALPLTSILLLCTYQFYIGCNATGTIYHVGEGPTFVQKFNALELRTPASRGLKSMGTEGRRSLEGEGDNASKDTSTNTGAIVGASVGVVALLGAAGGGGYYYYRKRLPVEPHEPTEFYSEDVPAKDDGVV